jgi:hypothetical protein
VSAPALSNLYLRARSSFDVLQQFGAQGNGITDDFLAIEAAFGAGTAYGLPVYFPPTISTGARAVYAVGRPLVSAGNVLLGDAMMGLTVGPTLRPLVPMPCLLQLAGRSVVQGLNFDGHGLATDAVQGLGCGRSRLDLCTMTGAVRNGFRLAVSPTAAGIGQVNQAGPGPAVTISQPDQTLAQYGTGTIYLRVKVGGALETATYEFSQDGISYAGSFTLHAQTEIPFLNGAVVYSDSGLRAACQAGVYQVGTVYSFLFTSPGVNPNDRVHLIGCEASGNGVVYATAGLFSRYTSFTRIAAGGTAAVTSGSNIATGTGTAWLSTLARDGDAITIAGAHFALAAPATGTTDTTMIVCVLGDGQLVLDQQAGANVSGTDWAIGSGAGFRVDPGQAHGNVTHYDHCEGHFNPIGLVDQGLTGPLLLGFGHENNAFMGRVMGTNSSD